MSKGKQVKIIKVGSQKSVWYHHHLNDIIYVKETELDKNLYRVAGPKVLIEYWRKKLFSFNGIYINKNYVKDIRKEKMNKILNLKK